MAVNARAAHVARENTHVCTREVDVVRGGVTLLRDIVAEDCEPMINPSVVEGQIAYDEDGNPLTRTFMDYLLPTTTEVPTLEYGHLESRAPGRAATRASAKAARSRNRHRSTTTPRRPSKRAPRPSPAG
ncbi:MAG TPA: molybdopterin cofactor-binding domain-containing protein, partial [Spirillospora sp.]|nr:molybdopterin cofactor-binding domain-containing protein [Spirillospora sp.]